MRRILAIALIALSSTGCGTVAVSHTTRHGETISVSYKLDR